MHTKRNIKCTIACVCAASLMGGCAVLPSTHETLDDSTQAVLSSSGDDEEEPSGTVETTTEPEAVTETATEEQTETEEQTWEIDEGFERMNQVVEPSRNINLRTGPGTEYESAGLLVAQTRVYRISDNGTWSQVIYNDTVYYAASEYLTVVEEGVVITKPADEDSTQQTEESASESETQPESTAKTQSVGNALPEDGSAIYSQYSSLDNTTIPFGFGTTRDESNRPTGVAYYENICAGYKADIAGPATSNTVYLTMDEGYEAGFTPTILDVLKEKNVKAVFFVTKQFVTEHPELVNRMIEEGHQIGNHTCSHPSDGMPSLGLEAEYNDIAWLHNYVLENFGYNMTLFRFPTGSFSVQSLALVNGMGYTAVFWSYAHNDWNTSNQPDVATALANCLNSLHPGEIFLLHAVSQTNTNNMAAFIDGVRAAGYEFGVYPSTGFSE